MSKSTATPDTTNDKNNENNTTSPKDRRKGNKAKILKRLGDNISADFDSNDDIPTKAKKHLQQTSTQENFEKILHNYTPSTNNNDWLCSEGSDFCHLDVTIPFFQKHMCQMNSTN